MAGLWDKLLGRKATPEAISYQARFRDIHRVLIFYPFELSYFRIARYTLQRLFNSSEPYQYLLVIAQEHEDASLYTQAPRFLIDPSDIKRSRQALRDEIQTFDPQLLLQLEPDPERSVLQLFAGLQIPLKMGFGTEQDGLDIIHAQKEHGFYEKNINNMIKMLVKI
jgi:hypothetical protein